MKTETKISSIALVCALCAVVTAPAMSAAPVRALGGAGTFSSASSAASSKTSGATATRAGSLRVLPSTTKATTSTTTTTSKPASAGTATTSTRALATPRLSIGKYLPHRVVASTGGSSAGGAGDGSTGGVDFVDRQEWEDSYKNLPTRVDALEAGVVVLEDKVTDLEKTIGDADVTELQTIVNNLQTNVNTIVTQLPADGEEVASAESVTQINTTVTNINTTIEQLKEQITKIEGGDSSASIAGLEQGVKDLQGEVEALKSDVADLETDMATKQNKLTAGNYISIDGDTVSVDVDSLQTYLGQAGDQVEISYDEANKTLSWSVNEVPGSVSFGEFATLTDVEDADKALSDELNETIAKLDARVQVLEGWLTTERKGDLELALINLDALIGAKEAISEYATVAELQKVKTDLEAIITGGEAGDGLVYASDLAALDSKLTALAYMESDSLIKTTLGDIQSNLETNYYTKAQVNEMLEPLDALELQKTDTGAYKPLGALAYENEIKAEQITSINATSIQGKITTEQIDSLDASKITGEITNAQLASGAVTADKISTGDVALDEGNLAMLVSDGNGGVSWQSVGVATGSDGK